MEVVSTGISGSITEKSIYSGDAHVGTNSFGSIFTTFGSLKGFAAAALLAPIDYIRWPGGTLAEKSVDSYDLKFEDLIAEPANQVPDITLRTQKGLADVLALSNQLGTSFSMIIPTRRYMEDVDTGQKDLAQFIKNLCSGKYGTLPADFTLEIGNESSWLGWEGGSFTPGEGSYGYIANAYLTTIRESLTDPEINPNHLDIKVAVQMGTTAGRGQASIFSQISAENLRTVDGFVRHSSLVDNADLASGQVNSGGYNFAQETAKLRDLHVFWEKAWGGNAPEMKILDTAWAVGDSAPIASISDLSAQDVGAKQAGAVIKMFSQMIASGSDMMAAWGVQDKASSLVSQDGLHLSYGGEAFRLMAESISGMDLVAGKIVDGSWLDTDNQFDVVSFKDASKVVIFLSAKDLIENELSVSITLKDFGTLENGTAESISTPGVRSEGYFPQNLYDAEVQKSAVSISGMNAAGEQTISYNLTDDYEVVRLTFDIVQQAINGTAAADMFTSTGGGGLSMYGGKGNDTYCVYNRADQVFEAVGEGNDKVLAAVSYSLKAGQSIEVLSTIEAKATTAINLTGNTLSQTIIGNAGDNILSSGGGAPDKMYGGKGNDTYFVYNSADQVFEAAGQGIDKVFAAVSYVLAAKQGIDVLATIDAEATTAINLTGNSWTQTIVGNAGANILNSGGGSADLMYGGEGDDIYYVFNRADQVFETVGEGNDKVLAAVSYALGAGQSVEVLSTMNAMARTAINLTGNTLSQTIIGNAGANILNSGGGAPDMMYGGKGNDTYFVYNSADQVFEAAGQGIDKVFAAVSYVLAAKQGIDVLATIDAAATTAINLTGNSWTQTIVGNAGANILDSGGGSADLMYGGEGDDIYYVFNRADRVFEATGEGNDKVLTAVSYALAEKQSIEVLSAIDTTATTQINLSGNSLSQTVIGNAGANTINGGGGADVLIGGAGADSFVFNAALIQSNADHIADFSVSEDRIVLENAIFTGLKAGRLEDGAFSANSSGVALDASDRIIYDTNSGQLWFDRDGNGGAAAVCFATVEAHLELTAAQFYVI